MPEEFGTQQGSRTGGRDSGFWIPGAALPAACAVITFLVYLPTLSNGFVNWDDQVYIYSNEMIRSMDARFFRWAFASVVSGNWHPLTLISHAIDYRLWGLDPWGHHLTAIILHSVNTALVGLIAARLVRLSGRGARFAVATGAVSALLFGLHPLHVESVAWASERKDLLSALFFLAAAYAYTGFRGVFSMRGRLMYAAALLFMALSLLSKPMAVTLPVVLLIIDYFPLGRFFNGNGEGGDRGGIVRAVVEKLPFFALSAVFSAVALWAQGWGGALKDVDALGFGARVVTAFKGYSFYLSKALVPAGLAPYYPYPEHVTAASAAFVISFVFFAVLTAVAVYSFRKRGYLTAAWAYYVAVLVPVSGLVQVGSAAAADRYFYLPGIPVFILAGVLFARITCAGSEARGRAAAAIIVLLAVSVALGALTVRQIGVWKDSVTLWTHEIERFPDTAAIAYANRGIAYGREGRIELALSDLDRAVEIMPRFAKAHYNRATALRIVGRKAEAIESLTRALAANPDYALAYLKRGELLLESGRYEEAITDFKALVAIDPGAVPGYRGLASAYSQLGDSETAAMYAEYAREAARSGR